MSKISDGPAKVAHEASLPGDITSLPEQIRFTLCIMIWANLSKFWFTLCPLYHDPSTCQPTEQAASWARAPPSLEQELDSPDEETWSSVLRMMMMIWRLRMMMMMIWRFTWTSVFNSWEASSWAGSASALLSSWEYHQSVTSLQNPILSGQSSWLNFYFWKHPAGKEYIIFRVNLSRWMGFTVSRFPNYFSFFEICRQLIYFTSSSLSWLATVRSLTKWILPVVAWKLKVQ